ncbi:MAG: hypothetical protein LQ338_003179 [Usnochroma carphineum]|nr:MAG: hypothetical protein LQ338_003179 [Usnochroma carphineum]
MVLVTQLLAVALTIAQASAIRPREPRGSPNRTPSYAYRTMNDHALNMPEPTGAPDFANRAKGLDAPYLTVKVSNAFGYDLPISYNSNAGSPTIAGNPGAGIIANTQNTALAFPRDFAGAIFIGKTYDPANSKIEVSFSAPQNYRPGLDVSYADGYGVPITCSCSGIPVTGCNIPLFRTGRTCANQGPGDRVTCYNPQKTVPDGPADYFFQPCQGAAYTYPNDHTANAFGKCDSGDIQCCVGVGCPSPSQQQGKHDLLQMLGYANETEIPAGLA